MERGCIGEGRHGGMDWEESGMEGWMERKEEWIDWKGIKEGWIGEERGMAMPIAATDPVAACESVLIPSWPKQPKSRS